MVEVTNSLVATSVVVSMPLSGSPSLNAYADSAGSAHPDIQAATDQAPLPALGQEAVTVGRTIFDGVPKRAVTVTERGNTFTGGQVSPAAYETWWESFHVLPRAFAFGNLLSTQTAAMEIYSAFRRTDENWSAFVNNGGAGITISGQPSLPHTFVPQSDGGLSLELEVSTSGQPVVDTTLDFVFNTVPQTIQVPITLRRVVLFSIQPEMPYTERLQWLTEVLRRINGSEQRISLRKSPRQSFEWDFILRDGIERAFFHNILFDWQARVFGLPMWKELTRTSSAVLAADTTISVQTTDYADYRVGGLFLIFSDKNTFDVLEVSSITSNSIVAVSGTNNAYDVGALVMPLRTGTAKAAISGSRFIVGDAKTSIQFTVTENDVDLADLSAFNSYNGKLLLDTCNSVRGSTAERFEQDIIDIDFATGLRDQYSPWANGKRITQLALLAKGAQGLWEHRQMLYALRGKQVSFYLPTFTKDFEPDGDITAGTIINVKNVGYTQFIQSRAPRNVLRIEFSNGDADEIREILSSVEVDSTREALTVDSSVATHLESEIKKMSIVELVRLDSDSITIRHEIGETTTRITTPTRTVFD